MLAGIASLAKSIPKIFRGAKGSSNPILRLLTEERDLKNLKNMIKPGSEKSSLLSKENVLPKTKGPLLRGESMKRDPDLISTGITGEGKPGGYYTTDVMKALDYAEGAPFKIDKTKTITWFDEAGDMNYKVVPVDPLKPFDRLGVIRRAKNNFGKTFDELDQVNLDRRYGPEWNLPESVTGKLNENAPVSVILSVLARLRMRPGYKTTPLYKYLKELLKMKTQSGKRDWRIYNTGGIVSLML